MIYLLSQIIDEAAERFPDKDAFRINGQGLTYADLVHKANALARTLQAQGVKRWDRVGIYLNKSLESAIAIYGIWKAGAAYVPLDPQAPVSRLSFVLQDCDIRHVVSEESKRKNLGQLAAETNLACTIGLSPSDDLPVRALSWEEVFTAPDQSGPNVASMEQDLAYVMYTSGSTGTPKGLMHTHFSGLSYAKMSIATYDVVATDRLSNHSPLHFDMSTFDYFSGPLAGATTVIIPEAYTMFPASLSKLIADEQLTIWYSVPFALIQLLLRGVLDDRDLSSLRWILFGGEPFPPKHLRALMQAWPQARFSNVYGPAEVNQCTYYHVPPLAEDSDEQIPIGQIWDNAEGLVIDEADKVVEPGEVGELVVRTPTMMQGYWGRPDLNERAFYYRRVFPNMADRFYRTGDLVQLQLDGQYAFLGRKDRQIKSRGYRVELDEIETALLSHQQVEEAAAFLGAEMEGSRQIEAAVLLKNGEVVTPPELVQYLKAQLPWYAVPAAVTIAETFPRTSSGKIDRRKLSEEALARTV